MRQRQAVMRLLSYAVCKKHAHWYNWVPAAVTKPVLGFGIHTALFVHSRRQVELGLCHSPTGMRDASRLTPCRNLCLGPALKVPMACTIMQQLALIHTCTPPCSSSWTASYGRWRRATAAKFCPWQPDVLLAHTINHLTCIHCVLWMPMECILRVVTESSGSNSVCPWQ